MRPAIVLLISWGSTCLVAHAADDTPGRVARSHIQTVGEIAAAERSTPWAGLVTARAPAVLREQFRLERGAGLVVESVAPGSVAERAGIRRHDVIVSIDGQLLLLPEQFVTLLEASGDEAPLECRILRGGVETMVSLRKVPAPATAAMGLLKPAESTLALVPRKQASVATVMQLPDGSLQQRDADYLVKLIGGDEPRLVIHDGRGRIIFNGPIDTPEQRSLVPPEVRSRVEGLERLVAQQQALKAATGVAGKAPRATARIGTLDIQPIQIK
ncbi:MAG: PDZ domain-containing protein [Planctomycetia bacterium]